MVDDVEADSLLRAIAEAPPRRAPLVAAASVEPAPSEATVPPTELVDTSAFALAPSRLRFVHAATEVAYRAWQRDQAVPFTRTGMVASIFNWLTALVAIRFFFPHRWPEFAALVLGVLMPVIVAALALSYRPRLVRWMVVTTVLANMFAGLVAVGAGYWLFVGSFDSIPQFATACTILIGFFGFAIFRLLPRHATLAVLPYFALNVWLYAGELVHGRASIGTFVLYTVIELTAFVSGLLACVTLDRISRGSYRQERIVQAQRELIDRLQRAEVQRQVAERSRDLSQALVRLADGPRAPARLAAGDLIEDRYRVVRTIGAGGMGQVHEVERIADRRRLALKVMTGVADPHALARFAREAQLAAELDHRNVVPAIDVGITVGGMLFLVMPLVAGASLDRARERYGDAAWARPILGQVADALVALHERGIVHRDLKPSNVLLDGDHVKVTDFGIASVLAGPAGEATPDADTQLAPAAPLTRIGHFVGTPLYMAPELVTGVSAGPPADVFSLGIIAYELLVGKAPYTTPPIYERLAGRAPDLPTPVATLSPALPRELGELVDRCLSPTPDARPSARELAAAFRTELPQ